jgi:hypothetical protein
MRKNAPKGTSSRKSITKPTAKRSLQIAKETIRTLSSDELSQAATGVAAPGITCPWNSSVTLTEKDPGGTVGA